MKVFQGALHIISLLLIFSIGIVLYQMSSSSVQLITNSLTISFLLFCLATTISLSIYKEFGVIEKIGFGISIVLLGFFLYSYESPSIISLLWSYLLGGTILMLGLALSTFSKGNKVRMRVSIVSIIVISLIVSLKLQGSFVHWIAILLAVIFSMLTLMGLFKPSN